MSEVKNTVRLSLDVVKEARRTDGRRIIDVCLTQGEARSTVLVAGITNGGKACDLTGCKVDFAFVRADGKGDSAPVSLVSAQNGTVSYVLPSSIAAVPGELRLAYFKVVDETGNVSITEPVGIRVEKGFDISVGQADEYIARYDKLLETFSGIVAEAEKQKNEQRDSWRSQMDSQQERFESAELARDAVIQGVRDDADAGKFDGAAAGFGPMTVEVDGSTGVPSATVEASGPDTAKAFKISFKNLKGERGPRGSDGTGVTTSLDPGFFSLSVEPDGNLYLTHNSNDPAPPLSIRGGELIYTFD